MKNEKPLLKTLECLIKRKHDDHRLATIGGVIEIVKCRRCKRLVMQEF